MEEQTRPQSSEPQQTPEKALLRVQAPERSNGGFKPEPGSNPPASVAHLKEHAAEK